MSVVQDLSLPLTVFVAAAGLFGCRGDISNSPTSSRVEAAVRGSGTEDKARAAKDELDAAGWPPVFLDNEGRDHRPVEDAGAKAVVLIFILTDCPIANSYLPQINRLQQTFASRGVRMFLIHADPQVTMEAAREHAREYEILSPVVLDPEHAWVQKAGAKVTPEAVVFSPAGEVLYRGRIDDQYVGVGQRRTQITSHDLEDALAAILTGKPVLQPQKEAVGCFIPELKR